MYPNQQGGGDDLSAWNVGPGYPTDQQGGFPGVQPGYPPNPQAGYPGAQPGYPGAQPGYPGAQQGYPQNPQAGYPGPQAGYAPNPQAGYAPNPQAGYAPNPQAGYAPNPQAGYPGQQQGYHPQGGPGMQPAMGGGYQMGPSQQTYPGSTPAMGLTPAQKLGTPTLRPFPNFNPDADCEILRKAMKGLGTDEKAIIGVLSRRTADQRAQLVTKFKAMYGKDLIKELKSELTKYFEDVVVAMCYTIDECEANELERAIKGAGTDEDALIEILCSRNNAQIRKIKEAYTRRFKRDLEKDIKKDTGGHFERLLVSLLQANRDENTHVDPRAVAQDAQELYKAGEKQMGTDESTFNRILCSKSEQHVRAVAAEYEKVSKRDLETALKSEMSGDVLRAFLSIVRSATDKPRYFAKELKRSMEGAGTRDHTLIRIIVTRAEVDMVDIKKKIQSDYGKSLESYITDDTSGDYKRMLLALIAEH